MVKTPIDCSLILKLNNINVTHSDGPSACAPSAPQVMGILTSVTAVMILILILYGYIVIPNSGRSLKLFLNHASDLVTEKDDFYGGSFQHFLSRPKVGCRHIVFSYPNVSKIINYAIAVSD